MKENLAKLYLLGQNSITQNAQKREYVSKAEIMRMDLQACMVYIAKHKRQMTLHNLIKVLRGIIVVHLFQVSALEIDAKKILGELNGDHLWNYLKK